MNTVIMFFVFMIWAKCLNYIAHILINKHKNFLIIPIFEFFMAFIFTTLWLKSSFFPAYFLLFSALTITMVTDSKSMLISRFTSLYLVPTGIIASYFDLLPLEWTESLIATIAGYLFLYLINAVFSLIKKQRGLGQGDLDLLALIGAYTGIIGCWFTILYASTLGTVSALAYMAYSKKRLTTIPFGPFISIGAILFVLFQESLLSYIIDKF